MAPENVLGVHQISEGICIPIRVKGVVDGDSERSGGSTDLLRGLHDLLLEACFFPAQGSPTEMGFQVNLWESLWPTCFPSIIAASRCSKRASSFPQPPQEPTLTAKDCQVSFLSSGLTSSQLFAFTRKGPRSIKDMIHLQHSCGSSLQLRAMLLWSL